MNLTELKQKPITELLEMAEQMGIDNMARSRKQDVIFSLLKKRSGTQAIHLEIQVNRGRRLSRLLRSRTGASSLATGACRLSWRLQRYQ